MPSWRSVGSRPGKTCIAAVAVVAAAQADTTCAAGSACRADGTEYVTAFPGFNHSFSREEFRAQYWKHGAVLLKFPPSPSFLEDSYPAIDNFLGFHRVSRMKISPVNNVSANPTNLLTGVSPLRMRFQDHAVLAPADDTVQGPHQEGASATRGNRRVIVFLCEEPADRDGGTAIFDMQKAWELLPADLKGRLANANWGFRQANGELLIVPTVVLHDMTGAPCLQFYCFGRVRRDCVDVYRHQTGRYGVRPDPYQYEMHAEADLLLEENGVWKPFLGLDLYRMLTSIYQGMIAHSWSRGEALVVDNIRWAHARLDGAGTKRKVHFYYYGPLDRSFDLNKLQRPKV